MHSRYNRDGVSTRILAGIHVQNADRLSTALPSFFHQSVIHAEWLSWER